MSNAERKDVTAKLDAERRGGSDAQPNVGSGVVGVIGDGLVTSPDAYEIVSGIQSVCIKRGSTLMIAETGGEKAHYEQVVQRFRREEAGAIIYATMFLQELTIGETFESSPMVLVNCVDSNSDLPAIIPDDVAGGQVAANALLRAGHARIAFIGLFEDMVATQMRLRGYKRALLEAGLSIDAGLVRTGVCADASDEFAPLRRVLSELFDLDRPPTAIICGNDKMAMRVYFLLRDELGKRIPDDVSVVGYDDYRMISANLVPRLTTVSLPYFDMGVAAAKLALSDNPGSEVRKIGGRLVERDSVGVPPC